MSAEQDEAAVRAELARLADEAMAEAWMRRWWESEAAGWITSTAGVAEVADFIAAANPDAIRRLLADLDAAENIARLAEESEAGWRREADELAERLAAVSALADEWDRDHGTVVGRCRDRLRAALTTTTGSEAAIVRWPHDTTVSLCQVTHSGPECEVPCEHAHSRRVSRIHAGRITALLAEHRLYGGEDFPGDYICGCGAEVPDDAWETDFGELLWHEAHVAEVLLHGATPTPAAEVGRREESGR